MTVTLEELMPRRYERWSQTPQTRIAGPDAAARLIDRLGLATLYPASPEVPNLYHAFMGDPTAKTDSGHDTPSGEVYTWRWALGGREAAFYSSLVRGRPTWIAWSLLPAVLRLFGEARTPDELHDAGIISRDAYRLAQALSAAGGVLGTGELRRAAGFPTGKQQRTAYLKALDELDRRLLLAKVCLAGTDEMKHALVDRRYPEHVAAAARLSRADALDALLRQYLPAAVYALPTILARHLGLPEIELRAGFDRLVAAGVAAPFEASNQKGQYYVWTAA